MNGITAAMKKLLLMGAALAALSNSVQAQTAVECANVFDRLSSAAGATGSFQVGSPQDKAAFNACADVVERVLKANSCTKFNPGGVYSAAAKIAKEHPIGTTVFFSWEGIIERLVVPRKDRC
jgi:hypothetical protein